MTSFRWSRFALICLATSHAACGASDPTLLDRFWTGFHAGAYDETAVLLPEARAAAAASPGDPALAILVAHLQLWRSAEYATNPSPIAGELEALIDGAILGYQDAQRLAPDEARIPCWLGLMQVIRGNVSRDPALVAAGHREIERGVELFPEFTLFCKVLANERAPYNAPAFQQAVDAAWRMLDLCYETTVDRTNPDIRPFLAQRTETGPRRVCWNTWAVPHQVEGLFLEYGDLMLKHGEPAVAKVMFENALHVDDGTWRFRDLVDERLATLDARTRAFRDGDPANDPPIGAEHTCIVCHAR